MSTGLTFRKISALYGLTNKIINTEWNSLIDCVVIASAVDPIIVTNKSFLPDHLLKDLFSTTKYRV